MPRSRRTSSREVLDHAADRPGTPAADHQQHEVERLGRHVADDPPQHALLVGERDCRVLDERAEIRRRTSASLRRARSRSHASSVPSSRPISKAASA
jgi:hypothetical protein